MPTSKWKIMQRQLVYGVSLTYVIALESSSISTMLHEPIVQDIIVCDSILFLCLALISKQSTPIDAPMPWPFEVDEEHAWPSL